MAGGSHVPALGLLAWLLAWLCCGALGSQQPGKVLVLPVDGSQWLSMKILVKELSVRGHDVLVLVPETSMLMQGSDGYRTEAFPVPYSKADLVANVASLKDGVFVKRPELMDVFVDTERLLNFTGMLVKGCEALLYNKPFMDRLRGEGFQLVLTDPFLPCGSIVSKALSIPAVYFLRGVPCGLDEVAAQCPTPPSYVPRFYSGQTDKMDFVGRVKNMLIYSMEAYMCRTLYASFDELTSRYLGGDMTYRELLGEGAIWLLRYDYTLEYPKPLMPNMIHIGGINCEKKTAPLPAELQEFVDGSGDEGFIVFTLGSWVSQMPEEKAKLFFDAFRKIPQRVVWRYTGRVPDDAPANVKVMKWLPQKELLGHPKVRAFITHGGSHGTYEGICNGVPVVMMPLFGDQGDNAQRMAGRGVGEVLEIFDVTSEKLLEVLNKVINNRSYKEKMVRLSSVHRDRPIEPLDLAVFWTEFVMRHKGAGHLRPAAHDLTWIQYHSLDVVGFLLVLLITVTTVTIKSCLFCFRKCVNRTLKKKKKGE